MSLPSASCRARAWAAGLAGWALAGAALAQAASAPAPATPPATGAQRPKVCLVLSGGGARGAAHVGVIKELQRQRIPVDCVVGTSMGSIVGASYAAGATVEEMEAILHRLNTRLLFTDNPPREERAVRLKRDDATNLQSPEVGVNRGSIQLPRGIVSGIQLEAVLRELSKVRGYRNFDHLPIPYRAVATDLVTGKAVVLKEGELSVAMRASMSVPGAIQPVRLGNTQLVDGGLTNNLPVDVARAMGADIVIAVNLGTPLLRPDQLNSILGVTGQMISILTEQNVQASLASLKATDILILPHLDDFSAADFDNLPAAVPTGAAATRAVADLLAPLALPPEAYARWDQRRTSAPPAPQVAVDEIRFRNLERVDPQVARSVMATREGKPIEQPVLDRDMQRLYGTGDFEHVSYSILEEPGKRILSVDAVEKSWGPNYLRLGLGLTTDFKGDAFFNLLGNYRMTWLNSLGAELRFDAQMGRTSRFMTEFYQPLQRGGPGLFVAPRVWVERNTTDIFQGDQRIATFDGRNSGVELAVGANFTRYGEIRLGLESLRNRATLDTGPPVFAPSRSDPDATSVTLRALVDQLDNVDFPRGGYAASLDYKGARTGLGGDVRFDRIEGAGSYVHSFGDHTLQYSFKVGRRLGGDALPPSQMFQWGGFLQQSGLPTGALIGEELGFARLVYYNRISRGSLLDGAYAGFSLEAGRMDKSLLPGNNLGTLYSGSLLIGVDTPIGPLYFAYGRADKGYDSFYLFLGRP